MNVPMGSGRDQGGWRKGNFQSIMMETGPEMKGNSIQVKRAPRVLDKMSKTKPTPTHILWKLRNTKEKRKLWKPKCPHSVNYLLDSSSGNYTPTSTCLSRQQVAPSLQRVKED